MIRRPPRSTHCISSAASDVYKRQVSTQSTWVYQESMRAADGLHKRTDKHCGFRMVASYHAIHQTNSSFALQRHKVWICTISYKSTRVLRSLEQTGESSLQHLKENFTIIGAISN
eukprot:TRINITY_DN15430_c0_g1_i2.p3 TRINITY_DN15430_c0_g1~~TRINITY_DN15430_c0_g1_i2.p3  ORF type:complete len:115 (+),score=16.75 TRINITY_DN15430_c0_g1_i2:149-493(+)